MMAKRRKEPAFLLALSLPQDPHLLDYYAAALSTAGASSMVSVRVKLHPMIPTVRVPIVQGLPVLDHVFNLGGGWEHAEFDIWEMTEAGCRILDPAEEPPIHGWESDSYLLPVDKRESTLPVFCDGPHPTDRPMPRMALEEAVTPGQAAAAAARTVVHPPTTALVGALFASTWKLGAAAPGEGLLQVICAGDGAAQLGCMLVALGLGLLVLRWLLKVTFSAKRLQVGTRVKPGWMASCLFLATLQGGRASPTVTRFHFRATPNAATEEAPSLGNVRRRLAPTGRGCIAWRPSWRECLPNGQVISV